MDNNSDGKFLNLFDHIEEGRHLLLDENIDSDYNFYSGIKTCSSNYVTLEEWSESTTIIDSSENLSVLHINCRSLFHKVSDVAMILSLTNVPILSVTETWLTEDRCNDVSIPGYNFVGKCRNGANGGGVGFYIKDTLIFDCIENQWLNMDFDSFEYMFIKLKQKKSRDIMIGSIYRPPNQSMDDFNNEFSSLLLKINNPKNKIILAGDFNIDLLKIENHQPTYTFFNIMCSHSLLPTILRPTRITADTATLIDNIFVNFMDDSQNSFIFTHDISDHCPVIFSTSLCVEKMCPSSYTDRIINSSNIAKFRCLLSEVDWIQVMTLCDDKQPCIAYTRFMGKYKELYNVAFPVREHLPEIQNTSHYRQPWMTSGLLKSCRKKSKLYKKYLKNPTDSNKESFIKYRNIFKKTKIATEKRYYANKFMECGDDLKQIWKNIKILLNCGSRFNFPEFFITSNSNVSDKHEIAKKFNEYFVNIGSDLADKIDTPCDCPPFDKFLTNRQVSSMGMLPITENDIMMVADQIRISSSCGMDGIDPSIAKATIDLIAKPMAYIIDSSISCGQVPNDIKIAKVIPLFKTGDKSNFSNYRPISILPYFSKYFEKIVYNKLIEYLNKNNLLSPNQYGFRKDHSTFMALLDMQSRILDSLDKNEFSMGIFLDLSKAFDTVDHHILIKKLEHYGIRGIILTWFVDFLKNRTQCVSFNGILSPLHSIVCGVPQGSILGPLLFLIYVNDLSNVSNIFKFVLFADDTNVFTSDNSLISLFNKANSELSVINLWFKANRLSLNIEKTNFIVFRTKRKVIDLTELNLTLDGKIIKLVKSCKFLGVYLDQCLTWSDHITHITRKIAKSIGIISRVRHCLAINTLVSLYYSLIFPYLSYCNISWGYNFSSYLKPIETLQKRAVRVIFRLHWLSSTKQIFNTYKILTLDNINKLQTSLFMFKFHKHMLPAGFSNFFTMGSEIHEHNTRTASHYRSEYSRTKLKQFSIKCNGPRTWNSLPKDLKRVLTLYQFKSRLKVLLLMKQ